MKAERRHELKTNSLVSGLEHFPEHWKEYGSRILLTILIAAITFLLVRYWRERATTQDKQIANSLESTRNELAMLRQLPLQIGGAEPASLIADQRQHLAQEADQSIATVLNSSKSVGELTSAYLSRGDLDWTLANFPELPGAETQPALKVSNREALLDQARASYEKVLEPASSPTPFDIYYARMGLAAIAENQGQWAKAKEQYQAISSAANLPDAFKEDARVKALRLEKIQSPVLIVQAPVAAATPEVPPTSHSTTPSMLGPEAPTGLSVPTTNAVGSSPIQSAPSSGRRPIFSVP
jgi:hypothetical protein